MTGYWARRDSIAPGFFYWLTGTAWPPDNIFDKPYPMGKIVGSTVVAIVAFSVSINVFGVDVPSSPGASQSTPRQKVIMGWLESIFIKPWNRRLTAKLDTGAKTSSLHADKIEHFDKNGEKWVRFALTDIEDQQLAPIVIERPLLRTALIKSHDNKSSKRDVVMLTVCKNGKEYEAEFNLVDRSHFNYPVLLGRSFLKDVALVDADETFLFKAEQDPCLTKRAGARQ